MRVLKLDLVELLPEALWKVRFAPAELPLEECLRNMIPWLPENDKGWAKTTMFFAFVNPEIAKVQDWWNQAHSFQWGKQRPLFCMGDASWYGVLDYVMNKLTFVFDPLASSDVVFEYLTRHYYNDPDVVKAFIDNFLPSSLNTNPELQEHRLRLMCGEPSQLSSSADRVELLEVAKPLFLSKIVFSKLDRNGYLAMPGNPKWFHFWGLGQRVDNPLVQANVEGLLQVGEDLKVLPKCEPGFVSLWKDYPHLWQGEQKFGSIGRLLDESYPAVASISNEKLYVSRAVVSDLRIIPIADGEKYVGVRITPSYGTSAMYVIPDVAGGVHNVPGSGQPRHDSLLNLLGLPKGKTSAATADSILQEITRLATVYEKEILSVLAPPRIRLWMKDKVLKESKKSVMVERVTAKDVPHASALGKAAGLDKVIHCLYSWNEESKWLCNTLCMITAIRHLRAATILDDGPATNLYETQALTRALLLGSPTDFPPVYLFKVYGESVETVFQEEKQVSGNVLTESADAIFG